LRRTHIYSIDELRKAFIRAYHHVSLQHIAHIFYEIDPQANFVDKDNELTFQSGHSNFESVQAFQKVSVLHILLCFYLQAWPTLHQIIPRAQVILAWRQEILTVTADEVLEFLQMHDPFEMILYDHSWFIDLRDMFIQ
jgi:hypothetical protein